VPFPAVTPSWKPAPWPRSKHEKRTAGSAWETWTVTAADGVHCARVRWEINFLLSFQTAPFVCVYPVCRTYFYPNIASLKQVCQNFSVFSPEPENSTKKHKSVICISVLLRQKNLGDGRVTCRAVGNGCGPRWRAGTCTPAKNLYMKSSRLSAEDWNGVGVKELICRIDKWW